MKLTTARGHYTDITSESSNTCIFFPSYGTWCLTTISEGTMGCNTFEHTIIQNKDIPTCLTAHDLDHNSVGSGYAKDA